MVRKAPVGALLEVRGFYTYSRRDPTGRDPKAHSRHLSCLIQGQHASRMLSVGILERTRKTKGSPSTNKPLLLQNSSRIHHRRLQAAIHEDLSQPHAKNVGTTCSFAMHLLDCTSRSKTPHRTLPKPDEGPANSASMTWQPWFDSSTKISNRLKYFQGLRLQIWLCH